jgi:thioredoxin 1
MSKVMTLTESNFRQELLDSEVPVLVDYWAAWCRPCRVLSPVIEEIARDYAGSLKVGKVDIDSEPELAVQAGVLGIPCVVLYRRGEPITASVGARSKAALEQALGLDAELDRAA